MAPWILVYYIESIPGIGDRQSTVWCHDCTGEEHVTCFQVIFPVWTGPLASRIVVYNLQLNLSFYMAENPERE